MTERRLNGRQRRLWRLHDFSRGRGLEIGPLHNTSIPRDHADVRYLDVWFRDRLVENYRTHHNVNPDKIPEIDFALDDGVRVRSIPEATAGAGRFDWVMASHVIEHVPDVVGWLAQVAEVTEDGGALVLIVPDRRYCFDVHRPGTTVGQLLQAHELQETVPSIRAVYDYKRGHAVTKAPDVWSGRPPGYEKRIYTLDVVREQVDLARAGEYIDGHVWTFTPGTLVEQIIELRELGLSEWAVEAHEPTRRNELEFFTVLRRLPRDQDWGPELLESEPPRATMPDWLEEWAELHAQLASTKERLRRRRDEVAALKAELATTRDRVRSLRGRLDEVQASMRWRAGGVVTRPLRLLRRR